jgi:hypothetical protein
VFTGRPEYEKSGADAMERAPAKCFEDLMVWQKAHHLLLATLEI